MPNHMGPNMHMGPGPSMAEPFGSASLPEEQKQLLDKVMKLTPDQIEKLHPQEKQQILQLRQAMMRYYPQ